MPSLDTRAAKMQGDWLRQRRALRSPSWGSVSEWGFHALVAAASALIGPLN